MAIIQNADVNVGPAHYKDLAPDELLITSIFFTIQGEGPHAGKPAVFIRLAGCNRGAKRGMGCEFCDTKFHFASGRRMTFQNISREIHSVLVDMLGHVANLMRDLPLLVITGGEPMMQENLFQFLIFMARLGFHNRQIESNGDRLIADLANLPGVDLVVSPKQSRVLLSEGYGYAYRPLRQGVWNRATALKFVISGDLASPYFSVPDWAHDFPREVYLSPMAEYREGVKLGEVADGWDHHLIDPELTKRNYQRAAKLAMETGFRVSIQQHLFLGLA